MEKRLNDLEKQDQIFKERLDTMQTDFSETIQETNHTVMLIYGRSEATLKILREMRSHFERRFEEVDGRFDDIEHRLDTVDRRFDKIDKRLSSMESDIKQILTLLKSEK